MGLDITQHGESVEDMNSILLGPHPEAVAAAAESFRAALLRRHLTAVGHPAILRKRLSTVAPDNVDTPSPVADRSMESSRDVKPFPGWGKQEAELEPPGESGGPEKIAKPFPGWGKQESELEPPGESGRPEKIIEQDMVMHDL